MRISDWSSDVCSSDLRAMLFLPAADLDPKAFAKPDSYNLDRENKTHIAFNAGVHRCLGSHLARVELQVCYEEVLKRLPTFRRSEEHTSELQSLMRISYAVFCLKKKKHNNTKR